MTEKKQSRSAGTNNNKDVIYIDVDDEITGIIDKVRGSSKKIVALVLPKRATVLQSVVNMKLLKRATDSSKKSLVLITSEAGLLPLAGSVGLHVAKSLQSKPEIPDGPDHDNQADDIEDTDDADAESVVDEAEQASLDKTKTVGELAGAAIAEDTIEMGDEDEDIASEADGPKGKKKKDKLFNIPNFNRFRLLLVLGVLGIITLGVLAYIAFGVLPKAQIVIKTDTTSVDSSTTLNLKTQEGTKLDVPSGTVPAHQQVVQKVVSQQVAASGQQNNGVKATGSVTLKNCTDSAVTIPAGTGVSSSGLTFITQNSVSLTGGNFTSGGVCKAVGGHIGSTTIAAQQAGAKYNLSSGGSFSVAGYGSGVTGTGSATTGGTDDIIKIVSQADIDSATQKIGAQDASGIKEELKTDLHNGNFFPVEASYSTAAPDTKTSAKAGDPAETVTVTQTINYTMLGVKEDDLKKVIANAVSNKIDPKKQSIIDYGLDKAVFSVQNPIDGGQALIMEATAVAGPDLDTDAIKKQVAGKKSGDAQEIIKANPGVTSVKVTYSPFWVSSIPNDTAKISVTVEKPQVSKSDDKP